MLQLRRSTNKVNSDKIASSIVILIDEQQNLGSISHFDNQYDLQSKDTLCLYFSQFNKVVYRKIQEKQQNLDLRQFATIVLEQNRDLTVPQISIDQMEIIFRRLTKKNKLIEPNTSVQLDVVIITNANIVPKTQLLPSIFVHSCKINLPNNKLKKKDHQHFQKDFDSKQEIKQKLIQQDQESEYHLKFINDQKINKNNQIDQEPNYQLNIQSSNKSNETQRKQINPAFVQIQYHKHKDFKIRQLFLLYKINKKGHSVLKYQNCIVRFNEPLSKLEPVIKTKSGKAIICSQIYIFELFYSEAKAMMGQMKNKTLQQQQLISKLILEEEAKMLFTKYQQSKSCSLDRLTHIIIIYLTSPYFNPTFQIQLFQKYFNGNLHLSVENVQTQTILILIDKMINFNSYNTYYGPVFVPEKGQLIDKHFTKSQIIRFQTFLAGTSQFKHLNNSKEVHLIYQIEQTSAKYVGLYSYQPLKLDYIFLPFTQFYVNYTTRKNNITIVKLVQLPLPLGMDTNLILWINHKAKQSQKREIYQLKITKAFSSIQFLEFDNNIIFQVWLNRYNSLTKMRKIGVISSIVGDQTYQQAVQTIHLIQTYLSDDVSVMLLADQLDDCSKIIATSKNISQTIICRDSKAEVYKFINKLKHTQKNQQIDIQECNLSTGQCKLI